VVDKTVIMIIRIVLIVLAFLFIIPGAILIAVLGWPTGVIIGLVLTFVGLVLLVGLVIFILVTKEKKEEPVIEERNCPKCNKPTVWKERYEKHYCEECMDYLPDVDEYLPHPPDVVTCGRCDIPAKYNEEMRRYYCESCNQYLEKGLPPPRKREEEEEKELPPPPDDVPPPPPEEAKEEGEEQTPSAEEGAVKEEEKEEEVPEAPEEDLPPPPE
jgi:hypothetical protein